jgi:hypothetical protein
MHDIFELCELAVEHVNKCRGKEHSQENDGLEFGCMP